MWKFINLTMKALDMLLQSCIPKEESPKRGPSNFSETQSKTQAVIKAIEREFGIIVDAVHDFPGIMEEKFDDFVQTMVEIPATIDESFEDFLNTMQEFIPAREKLI